jgi:hypothetical protein
MFTTKTGLGVLAVLAFATFAHTATADDSPLNTGSAVQVDSSKVPAAAGSTDATEKSSANAVPGAESVDDMITNNNLRAYSGSTSRWSIASQFDYNGGTISDPLAQDRPDISNASGTTAKSDLDGAISVKYNINAQNSIMGGVGIRWIAPLSTGNIKNYNGTAFDVMNPYAQYQYIYKWLGIQSVLQVQGMQWTQTDFTALGYSQQLNIDQENMYDIGKTGISVGASVAVQYQWFNKTGSYGSPSDPDNYIADVTTQQSQYLFTLSPELEYQLTEKVNLRTLVSLWTYEHYVSDKKVFSFVHDQIYQSVGVGVSVTRDIFLYPNIQFLPNQIMASETNVGLTATVNVF